MYVVKVLGEKGGFVVVVVFVYGVKKVIFFYLKKMGFLDFLKGFFDFKNRLRSIW